MNIEIRPRNIALAIVFSLITCGIYLWYWVYQMNRDVSELADEEYTSGAAVIVFSIITCGIYYLYWLYKMGERCDKINNTEKGGTAILFLILGLFGLSVVSLALMQDTVNKNL